MGKQIIPRKTKRSKVRQYNPKKLRNGASKMSCVLELLELCTNSTSMVEKTKMLILNIKVCKNALLLLQSSAKICLNILTKATLQQLVHYPSSPSQVYENVDFSSWDLYIEPDLKQPIDVKQRFGEKRPWCFRIPICS